MSKVKAGTLGHVHEEEDVRCPVHNFAHTICFNLTTTSGHPMIGHRDAATSFGIDSPSRRGGETVLTIDYTNHPMFGSSHTSTDLFPCARENRFMWKVDGKIFDSYVSVGRQAIALDEMTGGFIYLEDDRVFYLRY
jgi:hypothetical protein